MISLQFWIVLICFLKYLSTILSFVLCFYYGDSCNIISGGNKFKTSQIDYMIHILGVLNSIVVSFLLPNILGIWQLLGFHPGLHI